MRSPPYGWENFISAWRITLPMFIPVNLKGIREEGQAPNQFYKEIQGFVIKSTQMRLADPLACPPERANISIKLLVGTNGPFCADATIFDCWTGKLRPV